MAIPPFSRNSNVTMKTTVFYLITKAESLLEVLQVPMPEKVEGVYRSF